MTFPIFQDNNLTPRPIFPGDLPLRSEPARAGDRRVPAERLSRVPAKRSRSSQRQCSARRTGRAWLALHLQCVRCVACAGVGTGRY